MENKYALQLNLFVFLAGLLFVILFYNGGGVFNLVSIILGIMFLLPSGMGIIAILRERSKGGVPVSFWTLVPVVGGLVLGVVLVAMNEFFADILSYVFAALLIIGAAYKLIGMLAIRRRLVYPVWFYIIPLLIMACGIVLLALGIQIVQKWLSLIVGIAFMAYALNSVFEYIVYRKYKKTIGGQRGSSSAEIIVYDESEK